MDGVLTSFPASDHQDSSISSESEPSRILATAVEAQRGFIDPIRDSRFLDHTVVLANNSQLAVNTLGPVASADSLKIVRLEVDALKTGAHAARESRASLRDFFQEYGVLKQCVLHHEENFKKARTEFVRINRNFTELLSHFVNLNSEFSSYLSLKAIEVALSSFYSSLNENLATIYLTEVNTSGLLERQHNFVANMASRAQVSSLHALISDLRRNFEDSSSRMKHALDDRSHQSGQVSISTGYDVLSLEAELVSILAMSFVSEGMSRKAIDKQRTYGDRISRREKKLSILEQTLGLLQAENKKLSDQFHLVDISQERVNPDFKESVRRIQHSIQDQSSLIRSMRDDTASLRSVSLNHPHLPEVPRRTVSFDSMQIDDSGDRSDQPSTSHDATLAIGS